MFPFPSVQCATGGFPAAVHVASGSTNNNASGQATISMSGAQAGDLLLVSVYWPGGGLPLTTTGWNLLRDGNTVEWGSSVGGNSSSTIMWRLVTASDISAGNVTLSGMSTTANQQPIVWNIYRGAATAALVSFAYIGTGNTSVTIGGFSRDLKCCGIVAISHSRQSCTSRTVPTTFTQRVQNQVGVGSAGDGDLLAYGSYSGGSLSFTSLNSSGEHGGFIVELRAA